MTTDIEHEQPMAETAVQIEEPPAALEELLDFARDRVRGNMTRCPGCNLFVPISARRCQHCDSNIEANNALVRETLRQIDERSGQLDDDARTLDRAWRSMTNRIKRMLGRRVTITGVDSEDDPQYVLTGVDAGDQITVVELHGTWALVRTADGREGWVYLLSAK